MRYTTSIRKKSGRWYLRAYDRRTKERKEVAAGTNLKSAAERKRRIVQAKLDNGEMTLATINPNASEMVLLEDAVARFIAEKERDTRPDTVRAYQSHLDCLQQMVEGTTPVEGISLACLRPFLDGKRAKRKKEKTKIKKKGPLSVATRRSRFTHIRAFFRWMKKKGLIEASPLKDYRPPRKEKKTPTFLTVDDLDKIVAAIEADYVIKKNDFQAYDDQILWLKPIVIVAAYTGLRRGELVNLRWRDVDLDSGFIHVRNRNEFRTKSGSERSVPLVSDALQTLYGLKSEYPDAEPKPDDYVFRGWDGTPVNANYLSKRFKYYVKKAKLSDDLTFHSLRHTCASLLAMNGTPLQVIQQVLGHSSVNVTEIYAHLLPDRVRSAMEQAFSR